MKKMIIIVILIMISNLCFSAEIGNQFNLSSSNVMRYSSRSYKSFSSEKQFNKIIAGSCLMNVAAAGTGLTVLTFLTPMLWNGINTVLGVFAFLELSLAPSVSGIALLAYGLYQIHECYPIMSTTKQSFYSNYKRYLHCGMTAGIINGASFLTVMAGVVMHITAYFQPSPLMMFGIIPDVLGGLGLLVCLPMMIASLAIAAWCKGQLAEITPDIALTHDNKKSYNEGYSVNVGLRIHL